MVHAESAEEFRDVFSAKKVGLHPGDYVDLACQDFSDEKVHRLLTFAVDRHLEGQIFGSVLKDAITPGLDGFRLSAGMLALKGKAICPLYAGHRWRVLMAIADLRVFLLRWSMIEAVRSRSERRALAGLYSLSVRVA